MRGERFGHESDFDQRSDVILGERVKYLVRDFEIVDRRAIRLFSVDIGRAPLQRTFTVAGGEQIVRTEIHRDRTQRG
jgi:hypothetical protein